MAQHRALQARTQQLKGAKLRQYEQYTQGDSSRELYLKQRADTDGKIAVISEAIQKQQERMQLLSSEKSSGNDQLETLCKEFANTDKLTHELAHAFIKAVYVGADSSIEIEWKFKNLFHEN